MTNDFVARGIVLTAAEAANEGVEAVLNRLQAAGANSVAVTPGVFLPSSPTEGTREPPLDIEGEARTLDRPLWGSRVQYLKGYSARRPDPRIWRDVPFSPPPLAPEGARTDHARQIIEAASARGMRSFIIISPTALPGLPGGQSASSGSHSEISRDRIERADGSIPKRAVAGQGCLNSPNVQALAVARLLDARATYPEAIGTFIDWAEYTCYLPGDIFTCFCDHCGAAAIADGIDWHALREHVALVQRGFGSITESRLHQLVESPPRSLAEGLTRLTNTSEECRQALEQLFTFKTESVRRFYSLLSAAAGNGTHLGASTFPPPWNAVTGSDPKTLLEVVDVVRVKFFTFHWLMMARWLANHILGMNPHVPAELVLQAVLAMYEIKIQPGSRRTTLETFKMPRPDEAHDIIIDDYVAKLNAVTAHTQSPHRVEAYLHSYRSTEEFQRLIGTISALPQQGCWIQRHGYLSDDKLSLLRTAWQSVQ